MSRADHRYCPLCLPRLQMATVKLGVFVLRGGRKTEIIIDGRCDTHARLGNTEGSSWARALERDAAKAARRRPPILAAAENEAVQ